MADTAVVLGAGGITGVGWEIGILHGLARAGVDLTTADLLVGSSAGAVVAAQVASGRLGLAELYERQLAPPEGESAARFGLSMTLTYARAILSSRTPEEYGRKLGRLALARDTGEEASRREVIARRLLSHTWPERRLLVTAVDALTGALTRYDKDSGVPLVDAVAASCAVPGVWPPVTIDGRRWIDGGVHTTANAHLAAGYERVVVLAPIAYGTKAMASPRAQAARLAAAGARVEVITPDAAARKVIGRGRLDPALRAPAARTGLAQAAAHVKAVAAVWAQ
ncbi:patatin-like phospholipase family protein [Streptomyces sp.]|uniref:patatin-like phospholipase family protein n=1 Tax=Streptomyces sp. TaxID=1931 RepID=UPI002D769CD9|nr:patatin-like phospholipase family protein [Streptomyces sp.]HET6357216.1 patatin-like phospholipase family protein [Streptomyces sp.]